jgi:hypothetical protein
VRNNRGQGSIIALIVVLAIIAVLAYALMPRYLTGGGQDNKTGKAPTPVQRAEGIDCRNNLYQVRSAIRMYQDMNERPPATLAELSSSGISSEMLKCSVSGRPYGYDPSRGAVWCTTPGHEKY